VAVADRQVGVAHVIAAEGERDGNSRGSAAREG